MDNEPKTSSSSAQSSTQQQSTKPATAVKSTENSDIVTLLLRKELPLDKAILEVGSGPKGGVLKYLGDLPNITPTEADDRSYEKLKALYPRAIHSTAQNLPSHVHEKKYDVVLLTNTMGHIMAAGEEQSVAALMSFKEILKPGGKILVLQYTSPEFDFISERLRQHNEQGYIALPFLKSSKTNPKEGRFEFVEPGVTLVLREKLTLPFAWDQRLNLEKVIETLYPPELYESFYSRNVEMFNFTLEKRYSNFASISTTIESLRAFELKWLKMNCGFAQVSFTKLFLNSIDRYAALAGLSATIEKYKLARKYTPKSRSLDPLTIVYTLVTLDPKM